MSKLTYHDYRNFPDDGRRYEIVEGQLHVCAPRNTKHQLVLGDLFMPLDSFARARKLGEVFLSPCDVVLSMNDIVQPDLFVVGADQADIITDVDIKGVPVLVIEIVSEETRHYDETTKLNLYDRFGVAEYWIADPETDTFKIHRRVGSAFTFFDRVETITTPLLPGFSLDIHDVFAE